MKDLINKTTKLNLSSRKKRIAAFIIDQIILTIIMILILFLTLGTNFTIENNIEKISSMILAISITGFLLYCIKDSIKGTSVGKWIMGIMVRDNNDQKRVPSFSRLIVESLNLPIALTVTFLFELSCNIFFAINIDLIVKVSLSSLELISVIGL